MASAKTKPPKGELELETHQMGHTYSNILIHVIFSTKNREPSIGEAIRPRLYEYMAGIARKEIGRALKIGGTEDHVHVLLSLLTDVSLAEAICKLKSLSSGWVHKTFADKATFAWQRGYGAFSVSQSNKADVIKYIERQESHHKRAAFKDEYTAFLDRHGIEYDPKYVWG